MICFYNDFDTGTFIAIVRCNVTGFFNVTDKWNYNENSQTVKKDKKIKSIIVELSELPLFIKVNDKRETKEYVLKGQVNKKNKISIFLNKKEY